MLASHSSWFKVLSLWLLSEEASICKPCFSFHMLAVKHITHKTTSMHGKKSWLYSILAFHNWGSTITISSGVSFFFLERSKVSKSRSFVRSIFSWRGGHHHWKTLCFFLSILWFGSMEEENNLPIFFSAIYSIVPSNLSKIVKRVELLGHRWLILFSSLHVLLTWETDILNFVVK